jgi:hypothetical protein
MWGVDATGAISGPVRRYKGEAKMKKCSGVSILVLCALVLSGVGASSAAAAPVCYKVQETDAGNYSDSGCSVSVASLKGQYILSESLTFVRETLWCAKLAVGAGLSGEYKHSTCPRSEKNGVAELNQGEFVMVIKPVVGGAPNFSPATNKGASTNKNKTKFTEKEGIAAVECTGSEGTNAIENAKNGVFEETYTGCTAPLSGKCTGLTNSTKGDISTSGEFNLRWLKGLEGGTSSVALIFLINPVHFECEHVVSLIAVKGCVAGAVSPLNKKTKTFTVELKQTGGVENIKEVENEAGTGGETCVLKSQKNGEAEKEAGQEQKDEISEESESEIIT